MKKTLIAFATIVLSLGMALGQSGMDVQFDDRAAVTDLRASTLLGATVYRSDTIQTARIVDAVDPAWETVANVDDVILSQDGPIEGVLLDVGGFLGIGAHTVMVSMDSLQLVLDRNSNAVHVLVNATREQLENAPAFDTSSIEFETRTDFAGRVGVPAVRSDRFETIDTSAMTADDLTGAVVYDRFGDRVTGISEVVLSADGSSVESVVVDVGGFLGLFAHSVRVDLDRLDIVRDLQSGDVRVYLDLSQEELENLPVYDG